MENQALNAYPDPFRVIVAGSRTFSDYKLLERTLDRVLRNVSADIVIISGCARGADAMGERYARANGLEVWQFPADWEKYGKSAGYRRNAEMAKNADALVAFWDGESPGTKHMIDLAQKQGLRVRVMRIRQEGRSHE